MIYTGLRITRCREAVRAKLCFPANRNINNLREMVNESPVESKKRIYELIMRTVDASPDKQETVV